MINYKANLDARKIKLSNSDIEIAGGIAVNKLKRLGIYEYMPEDIKNILKNNVLIVATTDLTIRATDKLDIIIENLDHAISLVMKDVRSASQYASLER